LVNFNSKTSLLDWCNLRLDLEDLLGTKVDVASEKTLKPRIKDRVLEEAIDL
jgi:predicted nucleotidyltransferase